MVWPTLGSRTAKEQEQEQDLQQIPTLSLFINKLKAHLLSDNK